jgi:hypothetical protein
MSILSLYVHYSATLYLFFQIHSPAALSIHSLLYLNILFFILLSHLNIIFFIHSLLLFTSNNYPYNPNSHNPNPSHPPPPPPPPQTQHNPITGHHKPTKTPPQLFNHRKSRPNRDQIHSRDQIHHREKIKSTAKSEKIKSTTVTKTQVQSHYKTNNPHPSLP